MTPSLEKQTAKAAEPAKRWVNWWEPAVGVLWKDGSIGALAASPRHPSKDIAETFAAKIEKKYCKQVRYLGAYPEGERP